jgi:hypothetical protein
MNRVREYLSRAVQADRGASAATDREVAAELREVAHQWRALARQAKDLAEYDAGAQASSKRLVQGQAALESESLPHEEPVDRG